MEKIKITYLIAFSFASLATYFVTVNCNEVILKAENFMGEKISATDQEFVDSIAKELEVHNPGSYYMNKRAQDFFGPTNIVAFDNVLLLGPDFLNALSLPEKRFIIGRELLLIDYDLPKKQATLAAKYLIGGFVLLIPITVLLAIYFPHRDRYYYDHNNDGRASLAVALSFIPFGLKLSRYLRSITYKFDEEAAIKLNEFDGGISYFKNYDKYYSHKIFDAAGSFMFAQRPTYQQRIAALEKLKFKYS